jgi:dTDP-4-dehydrorhamnose reductase
MNIFILGSTGIIGSDLCSELSYLSKVNLICLSSSDLDVYCNLEKLEKKVVEVQPDIIINAIGFTNIDTIENNKNKGFFLNCLLPHLLAEICYRMSIQLVHFSSDNVFDGLKNCPYTEKDKLSPINYYGWTKAHTDKLLLDNFQDSTTIFRISGIYSHIRKNFFTSFLNRLTTQNMVQVVDDISVSPTPAKLLAKFIAQLIDINKLSEIRGLYHLTPKGGTSWFDFAKMIVESLNLSDKLISPVSSDISSTKVKRPQMCLLVSQKLEDEIGIILPTWDEAFREFLDIDTVKRLITDCF